MHLLRTTSTVFLWIGVILMGLNVLGLVVPLRNPHVYQEHSIDNTRGISLTERQFYQTLMRIEIESAKELVTKINEAVNRGIANIRLDRGISHYNFRVPLHENFILFFASLLYPDKYTVYEYCDEKRAIERGVGLCSQQVGILSQILDKHNIDVRTIGLDGHVVATAQVDAQNDIWWTLDPDYGVVIPYAIQQIEETPSIVAPFYKKKGYTPNTISNIVAIYGREGNEIVNRKESAYFQNICKFERRAYIAKWVIPLILIIPGLFFRRKKFWKHL